MSTFNGIVREFPNIRIDYFRTHPGRPPPAAYFLSHVHSDHLLGLESVKMPFVYCSATTKHILLKMEKYPHRINFAKGILESRKQHYRHLKLVLKALPLNTATELELGPKSTIRVTLLDANHCPGAVMFLIEGDGKAVVYTGDIRAEPWWVNSIVQNPVILPYTCGLKTLDCIYLDTTFASHSEPYKDFPTKAEGLKELLEKVSQCPPDTVFYFRSWTLGYEKVWVALSDLLQSRIHVDGYQLRILRPNGEHAESAYVEGASLTGFAVGNHNQLGCLTTDKNVRIHSCEPGLECHVGLRKLENIKFISPIISRLRDGTEVRELGAGGGGGDLYQTPELKVDSSESLQQLEEFCANLDNDTSATKLREEIANARNFRNFTIALEGLDVMSSPDATVPLQDLVALLSKSDNWPNQSTQLPALVNKANTAHSKYNDTIHFPYSRHSSYSELRHLVGTFRPKDICSCTVSLDTWSEELSMESLFGDLCSAKMFYFDHETRAAVEEYNEQERLKSATSRKRKREEDSSQRTQTPSDSGAEDVFEAARARTPAVLPGVDDNKPPVSNEDLAGQEQVAKSPNPFEKQRGLIEAAFLRLNGGSNYITSEDDDDSLPRSAFESQSDAGLSLSRRNSQNDSAQGPLLQATDGLEKQWDPGKLRNIQDNAEHEAEHRRHARMDAYEAARLCLEWNDSSRWDALSLRSVGRVGHSEPEAEL
jgi:hypothetical protein